MAFCLKRVVFPFVLDVVADLMKSPSYGTHYIVFNHIQPGYY